MNLLIRPRLQFADPLETGGRFRQSRELAPSNFSSIRVPTAVTKHCGQHAPEQQRRKFQVTVSSSFASKSRGMEQGDGKGYQSTCDETRIWI